MSGSIGVGIIFGALDLFTYLVPLVVAACGVAQSYTNHDIFSGVNISLIQGVCVVVITYSLGLLIPASRHKLRERVKICLTLMAFIVSLLTPMWAGMYILEAFGLGKAVEQIVYTAVIYIVMGLLLKNCPERWSEFIPGWGIKGYTLYQIHLENMRGHTSTFEFGTRVRFFHQLLVQMAYLQDILKLLLERIDASKRTAN